MHPSCCISEGKLFAAVNIWRAGPPSTLHFSRRTVIFWAELKLLLDVIAFLSIIHACSIYILSLLEGSVVDPAADFAGRTAGGSSSSTALEGSGLLGPKPVQLTPAFSSPTAAAGFVGGATTGGGGDIHGGGTAAAVGNRAVAWWGPRVLAVAAADGAVALARLPGSVNILGAAPVRFAPGEPGVNTALCSVQVQWQGHSCVSQARAASQHGWCGVAGHGAWLAWWLDG